MSDKNELLKENIDFYYNEDGNLVLTREYHLSRGRCCTSGCINCPYGIEDFDPLIPMELQMNKDD